MARARNIKPGFFANDELAECDPLARILFAGLWTIADKEGRLEYRPKRIKRDILPYDNCDIEDLLKQLAARNFIIRYEVEGAQYIEIPTFSDHQNPHQKEPDSTIPASDSPGAKLVLVSDWHSSSRADSLNLIPDSLNPITDSSRSRAKARRTPDEDKKKYAEFVTLTEDEHQKLVDKFGEAGTKDKIEALNLWKGSKGKKTASDYMTILNWDRREKNDRRPGTPPPAGALAEDAAKLWHSEVVPNAGPYAKHWSSPAVLAGVRRCGGGTAIAETKRPDDLKRQFIEGYCDYKRREAG
jgi:hypothetical protein